MKRFGTALMIAVLLICFACGSSVQALSLYDSQAPWLDTLVYSNPSVSDQLAVSLSSGSFPVVNKDPTGETVSAGGGAYFIAKGSNWHSIVWHFGPETGTEQPITKVAEQFPGVIVIISQNEEKLYLGNIPYGMNGWRISAELVGYDGQVFTKSAVITVLPKVVDPPRIISDPRGAELEPDETTTLRVEAVEPDKGDLVYQWYKSTTSSIKDAWKIIGATDPVYVPEYSRGTFYYFCAVYIVDGTETSVAATSKAAAVTYASRETIPPETESVVTVPPETETTEPVPSQTAATESASAAVPATEKIPTETTTNSAAETTETSASVTELPSEKTDQPVTAFSSNDFLVLVMICVAAAAVICFLLIILVLHFSGRRRRNDSDFDEDDVMDGSRHSRKTSPEQGSSRYAAPPEDETYEDFSELNMDEFFEEDR